jgi:hypothetical protein
LSVHSVNEIRQAGIHTAEPLVSDHSPSDDEVSIFKLTHYKSLGIDQIVLELIQALGETLCSATCKLITSVWNKEELPKQWKGCFIVPVYKTGYKSDYSNYQGITRSGYPSQVVYTWTEMFEFDVMYICRSPW